MDQAQKRKRAQRAYPPLTDAQLLLCPNGEPNCRICQLRPEQIKDVHQKRLEKKFTYAQIRDYVKTIYKLSLNYTEIGKHFNIHLKMTRLAQTRLARKKDITYPDITKALEPISDSVKISTSGDLEKAYAQLVNMAQTFTERVFTIQEKIALTIDHRDIDTEIDGIPVIELLEKQARLNKEAREFIKEVSILRAPKVMVAQFLETFIDAVIKELSVLISNLAGELKHDITAELADAGHPDILSDLTFANIFKQMAMDYRDRMVNLKRQKMADALAALQDLEKLI